MAKPRTQSVLPNPARYQEGSADGRYRYLKPFVPEKWQKPALHDNAPILLFTGTAGGGKLLALDTPIPTPDGWTTVEDVQVGQRVFDETVSPTRVVAISDIEYPRQAYEITFGGGEKIVAGDDHRWFTHDLAAREGETDPAIRTTKEISNSLVARGYPNHAIKRVRHNDPGWDYIVRCRPVENQPMKCIQVDTPSHLYLVSDSFIPTHNSILAANKCHAFPLWFPGANVVIMRKVAEDMPKSVMALMRNSVIGSDPRVTYRLSDGYIEYKSRIPGGPPSFIWFVGIKGDKQRTSLRSIGSEGAIDLCWMEEGIEYDEEDFEEVLFRMRGHAAPWTQIMITTNPGPPAHWIYQRLILNGQAKVYYSSYLGNTHNPDSYRDHIEKSRGLRRSWLKEGRWVAGENMVVDGFLDKFDPEGGTDEGGNVTLEAEFVPDGGPVVWIIDDGYAGELNANGFFTEKSGPRAVLFGQKRPDGRTAIFYEDYRVKTLASKHLSDLKEISQKLGYPPPLYVVYDGAAAQLGGELVSQKYEARGTRCKIDEGLKELNEWISSDDNGYRRIVVHPRCKHLRYEMVSYVYGRDGKPIDGYNHGVDALRVYAWHETFGATPPSDIAVFGATVDISAIETKMNEVLKRIGAEWLLRG